MRGDDGEPRSAKTPLELSSQFRQAVRSDHPLRRIDEVLKLDFVRGELARFYGRKGNVSEGALS
jgi:hypothetical protein